MGPKRFRSATPGPKGFLGNELVLESGRKQRRAEKNKTRKKGPNDDNVNERQWHECIDNVG